MTPLHPFLALGIAVAVINAMWPKIGWLMSKWQYKNPEKNEPSEAYFTMVRVSSAAAVIVCIAIWIAMLHPSSIAHQ
ncbi:hypothetical protein HNR23_003459 [Nocardiopsis mwathae]|uniref:DUF6199 domain-containing protein n=1 Tax=Nocardiopsis mwathae TaxID=1472723 RepID=A0A7W9YJX5_9ACTN|nr:DUF6199 family natural product biosynthesis protein [Nocardiopsis mwathae]MBB6173399.1 hypothetical protein [Nocardiopsis mwathae]